MAIAVDEILVALAVQRVDRLVLIEDRIYERHPDVGLVNA